MQPILFSIGGLSVPAYGIFVLLGLAVALLLTPRYAHRNGLDPKELREAFFVIFVFGAIGCRLLYVVQNLPEVIRDPDPYRWIVQQAGIWYGAIIGGFIGATWAVRKFHLPFWRTLDTAAVPVVIGGGIGRLGCLLSGCCFGKESSLPWAVRYDSPLAHRLHPDLPYTSLHPAPLYELGAALAIAFVVDRFGRGSRRPGQTGLLWLALYAVARTLLELFRGDRVRGYLVDPWISTSQAISLAAILSIGIVWYVHFHLIPNTRS